MENSPYGEVVPTPTLPALVTMKLVAEEEPMTKDGLLMPLGFTESCAQAVVVPMPSAPVKVEVAVEVARRVETVRLLVVAMSAVPLLLDVMMELAGNEEELVPPWETGRVAMEVRKPPAPKVAMPLLKAVSASCAPESPPEKVEEELVPRTERKPCKVEVPVEVPWMVEVADPPKAARMRAATSPEKVEVELVPFTVRKPWRVEVPVVAPWSVEVAVLLVPMLRPLKTSSCVVEAFPRSRSSVVVADCPVAGWVNAS